MTRFYHVGLTVADLDRSVAFYHGVLGMSPYDQSAVLGVGPAGGPEARTAGEAGAEVLHMAGGGLAKLTDNPGCRTRAVFLEQSGFVLQLVQYDEGAGASLRLQHNRAGSVHLSFYVPDVAAWFDELGQRPDVAITSEIVQITPTMRSFYVSDPDGVPVEFLQGSQPWT
jgi:catechol 2,3-dioxygenase-like lactoylglutathione lyase family enzyme